MAARDHTVLVLGAGASLAEAIDRRPKRDRDHPPLDITFFRRASKHRDSKLLRDVVAQAAAIGEPDLTSVVSRVVRVQVPGLFCRSFACWGRSYGAWSYVVKRLSGSRLRVASLRGS